MTNSIFIHIDTEMNPRVSFSKPPDIEPPKNKEEACKMILNDIACLAGALKEMIILASQNDYGNNLELINASIKTVGEALIEESKNNTNENR